MRLNQLNPVRLCRASAAVLLLGLAAVGSISCDKGDPNAERDEYLKVYNSLDEDAEADIRFSVGVRKGEYPLYLKTNVELDRLSFEWQDEGTSPWASVSDVSEVEKGCYCITLKVKARSPYAYYTRRSGMLIITCPEQDLGTFITVTQGCIARFSNNCENFKYGVSNPYFPELEKNYSAWSTTQKNYFLTENFAGGKDSYIYAGNGYLKLGDDKGHGGCITTPYTDALRADSLLMVSFRAVAYADANANEKDNNRIKVDILGGGVFRDNPEEESRSMELEVPHLDYTSEEFPDNMWDGAEFTLFVQSSARYPITADTQIRITSGSLSEQSAVNSRVYVKNVYIRRLDEEYDEDYFAENGGSGVDRILGLGTSDNKEDDVTE